MVGALVTLSPLQHEFMERKTSLSLPREVPRLSTPNLWVHAVQEARLVLSHLQFPRRVRVKVGHTGGLCTTLSPAQTMLQTAMAPVGRLAPFLCYLALPLRFSRPSWTRLSRSVCRRLLLLLCPGLLWG